MVFLTLDVTTLAIFYEGEQWHSFSKIVSAWAEGIRCRLVLPLHELKYRATDKLECYILVMFIALLLVFQGTGFGIVFAFLDYVLVCLRVLLGLRLFASSESYDMGRKHFGRPVARTALSCFPSERYSTSSPLF